MTRKSKRYYSLLVNGAEADLDIYGDITSECPWGMVDSDMSAWRLSRKLEELDGVSKINVNINSYGGEVAEGIAIYNALRRHPAEVTTRCDGMACSIASVIFMAGTERIMYPSSMLMIHNASTMAWGTAAELRKAADDSEKITSMSKAAYMAGVNIDEAELTRLMDAESWISPDEALEMGFATAVADDEEESQPTQSTRHALIGFIMAAKAAAEQSDDQAEQKATEADDTDDDETDDDDGQAETDDSADDGDADGQDGTDDDGDADDADDDDADDDKKEEQAAQRMRSFIQKAL